MVYNANGLYHHNAQTSNEFKSSEVNNKKIVAYHGYSFAEYLEGIDMHLFPPRAKG